jgi:hypothetical protein
LNASSVSTSTFFLLFLAILSPLALADGSGSMSRSCSGQIEICEGGICLAQPFYIYAYQYANIRHGEIVSESHNHNFSGFLGDANAYRAQGFAVDSYVIYQGPDYQLAIPYDSKFGLYFRSNRGRQNWRKLCAGDDAQSAPPYGHLKEPVQGRAQGSATMRCSGNLLYCEGNSCSSRYFNLYTYQWASIALNQIQSESHSFSFSGILGLAHEYELTGFSGYHLLYEGPEFALMVPFKSGEEILARQLHGRNSRWQNLCPVD